MLNIYITDDQDIMANFTDVVCNKKMLDDIVTINSSNIIIHLTEFYYYIDINTEDTGRELFIFKEGNKNNIVKVISKNSRQIEYIENIVKALKGHECNVINICRCNELGQFKFYIIKKILSKYNIKFYRVWFNSLIKKDIKISIKNIVADKLFDNLAESFLVELVINKYLYDNRKQILRTNERFTIQELFVLKTVAKLTDKEKRDESHKLEDYYKIELIIDGIKGLFINQDGTDRINTLDKAILLCDELREARVYITEMKMKNIKTNPPLLYNKADVVNAVMTSRKKFTVILINDILTSLYNKGLITNPDTTCRHLTEDFAKNKVVEILKSLRVSEEFRHYIDYIRKKVKQIELSERVVNNQLVDQDIAIVPTTKVIMDLDKNERYLYNLIVMRFIAVIAGTSEIIDVKGNGIISNKGRLKIDSRETIIHGHKIIMRKNKLEIIKLINKSDENESRAFISLNQGQFYDVENVLLKEGHPRGKITITVKRLLKIMENTEVGVKDEKVRIRERNKGIGNIEDREECIKDLIANKYIDVSEKDEELKLTNKSIYILEKTPFSLDTIVMLNNISRDIKEQKCTLKDGVERAIYGMNYSVKQFLIKGSKIEWQKFISRLQCPLCQTVFLDKGSYVRCKNNKCNLSISKIMWHHVLTKDEILKLCMLETTNIISDFIFKNGKTGKGRLFVDLNKKKVQIKFK